MSQSWDIIVVGAGSSGATFAARSAEKGHRVLLLEAGKDFRTNELPQVWRAPNPLKALLSASINDYLWPDLLATRTNYQAPCLYWRGRGMGGSSTINGQIAIRPPREDFEEWASVGCSGWSWEAVLPYFCRLERDQNFGAAPYHGHEGPVPIYRASVEHWGPVDNALRLAALEHGFDWAEDVNAPCATGVSPYPINSFNCKRVSTNDAYLEPARSLATLEIRGDCLVHSVVFDGHRASGVRLADCTLLRSHEVVLSAGVIGSPSILMRSGIGPSCVLRPLGIDMRQDLPVGRAMQDHPMSWIRLPIRPEFKSDIEDRHTNCCIRFASDLDSPNDMMIVAMNHFAVAMNLADFHDGAIGVWVNRVYSEGSVEIVSDSPSVQPYIRMNMLSDERDRKRMREGVRLLATLSSLTPFRNICEGDLWRINEDLKFALHGTAADLDNYLVNIAADAQHGTSTCRMGSPDAKTTVVGPDCRVLGTVGLSVIDASIFPFVPRANTHLVSVMTGELMADRFIPHE